jgi:hypothetical protein
VANLSHVVSHLSFGPILSTSSSKKLEIIPSQYFALNSTQPINDRAFLINKLHQAFHHYIKVDDALSPCSVLIILLT